MNERKQLLTILFCALMVSMPLVQAFSTAVPGSYVIYLERDQPITQAMDTIQKEIPGIHSIAYGSVKFHLLSHRVVEPLVWIGHGDKEGINSEEGKITWEIFAKDLLQTPTKDVVLACHSGEILKQTTLTSERVITFDNEIDSILGGLITSYLLTGRGEIIMDAALHYRSILKGEKEYHPLHELDPGYGGGDPEISQMLQQLANIPTSYAELTGMQSYVLYKMSGIELGFHFISLILLIIELLLLVTLAPYQFSFIQASVINFMTTGMVTFLTAVAYYQCGQMTEDELVDEILSIFPSIGECIWKALKAAPVWEKVTLATLAVISGAILFAELLGDTLTAGLVTATRIAITVVLILLFIYDFVYDLIDENTIPG